jgi:hypothetical protein
VVVARDGMNVRQSTLVWEEPLKCELSAKQ